MTWPARYVVRVPGVSPDARWRLLAYALTGLWNGRLRPQIAADLRALGYDARLNEPWSGKEGFMFSADWHARDHGARALMIEVRQDLLIQPEWRARFLPQLVASLAKCGLR